MSKRPKEEYMKEIRDTVQTFVSSANLFMTDFNIEKFADSHPTLLKVIIHAMNQHAVKAEKEALKQLH